MDAVVGEVHRSLGEVGEVAGLFGVLVEVSLHHLQLLSPIGIGVGEVEVGMTGSAPRLVGVSQPAGDGDEGGRDLPDEQKGKRGAPFAVSIREVKSGSADQNVKWGKDRE